MFVEAFARVCLTLLKFLISGIFIYSGLLKIIDQEQFYEAIESYDILPVFIIPTFAFLISLSEFLFGMGLLIKKFFFYSLYGLISLTLIFLTAICQAWYRGLEISCGCIPTANPETYSFPDLVMRDVTILAILILLFLKSNSARSKM